MQADTELPEATERPPLDQQRRLLPLPDNAHERLLWRTNANGRNVVGAGLQISSPRHREWLLTLHCRSSDRRNQWHQLNGRYGERPRLSGRFEEETRAAAVGREEPTRSVLQFVKQFRVPIKKPK